MARTTSFTKRSLIGKANSTMVIATTAAAFVLVFAIVAGRTLASQMSYQNRVITAKKAALTQLKDDLKARDALQKSYSDFISENPNILGGDPDGSGDRDGDNAKLILDALPSKYDFPALATSLEKLINSQSLEITGISGTDQEAAEAIKEATPTPEAVPMPFQLQVNGSYESIQSFVDITLKSIRPIKISTMELTGDQSTMSVNITAQTYYQPEKSLNIRNEVVK
ncbi:MAG TPA: type 4a pilus biogenesis protein PilO [Candidatus Saccharimonadales bacterium]|nr:type 4a pilus biogenesis protein PilO [Candidatus Saccharimonadales bacterium]